jgi:ABC-type transport system involved in multi-copper enzyme maturation permease subunit
VSALLAGEVQRLLARRLVRVLALLAVLAIALAGALVFLNTEDVSSAELSARRRQAFAEFEACLERRGPEPGPREVPEAGGSRREVPVEERCGVAVGDLSDPRFALADLKGILQGTTGPLVVVAWLMGASSIGADWQSRTITSLLTWEPRRARVLFAKASASAIVACGFALLTGALLVAALLPSAYLHGTTAGTGGTFGRSLAGVVLRSTAMIAIASTLGFAVASIGRNTAAALGIGFGYFLVFENVVGSFLADYRRWLLLGNAIVFIAGEEEGGEVVGRTVLEAGAYLAVIALLLLAAAAWLFRRRDVA